MGLTARCGNYLRPPQDGAPCPPGHAGLPRVPSKPRSQLQRAAGQATSVRVGRAEPAFPAAPRCGSCPAPLAQECCTEGN